MGFTPKALARGKNLTSEKAQVDEIIKCGKDPVHFMKNWAKIQHPTRGKIPFETYEFQDRCVSDFEEHRLNIVLKSRQLGLSTVCAAYCAWLCLFHRDKNVLVIATKLTTAITFISKVKVILQSIPEWMLLSKFIPTKQEVAFDNGSWIKAVPTSEDAGRSEALSLLIVDEAAFIREFDEIWTGLAPTISTGGRAIIISTPNGVGGQFYKLWTEASAGVNGFNPINLPWAVHPEHDEEWFKKETRNLSKRSIGQEYLCDFTTSGDTFLSVEDLDHVRKSIMVPIEKTGDKNALWIWSHPIDGRQYLISADIARGDARDFSTFHVIDVEEAEVVAEYMGKVPPEKLADMLADAGHMYNNAFIMPEQNTFGYFVNTKLRDTGYPKLYYHNAKGDPFSYTPLNKDELPGFPTSAKTRVQALTKLNELIRTKVLKIYSQRLFDQLQAFVWNGARAEAAKDSFDDLVMSIAIGCWLIDGNGGLSKSAVDQAFAMLRATKVSRTSTEQGRIGGINDARPLVNPNIQGSNPNSVYRPRHADAISPNDPLSRTREMTDFRWLLK